MSAGLTITVSRPARPRVVVVAGEIDLDTAEQFRAALTIAGPHTVFTVRQP